MEDVFSSVEGDIVSVDWHLQPVYDGSGLGPTGFASSYTTIYIRDAAGRIHCYDLGRVNKDLDGVWPIHISKGQLLGVGYAQGFTL